MNFGMLLETNDSEAVESGKLGKNTVCRAVRIHVKCHWPHAAAQVQVPDFLVGLQINDGDRFCIDGAGYVYIVGRAKDLVISGGFNVYPKEVETELDAVTGVVESAVFGVPHPDFGEGVTAAVVREAGAVLSEAEIIGAVKPRLAGYKIPKRIVFVDELPRNAMGKVQKAALRTTFASLYRAA